MEITNICPKCHSIVEPTDYYCYNCGENLKPTPPSLSSGAQITLYLISFFLPPFGIFRGLKYLRQKEVQYKTVGIIAIVLTAISILVAIVTTSNFANNLNRQMNEAMQQYNGLY